MTWREHLNIVWNIWMFPNLVFECPVEHLIAPTWYSNALPHIRVQKFVSHAFLQN